MYAANLEDMKSPLHISNRLTEYKIAYHNHFKVSEEILSATG